MNDKKDVSIEYAHIYTNDKINEEHKLSLDILGSLKKKLVQNNQSAVLVILVDDYSFPDPSFSYEEFENWLSSHGHHPDLILRESQLIPLCDVVIAKLHDGKLQKELTEYIKAKKYPCSLFVAAWYLLRLGYLSHDSFNEDFYAQKLINILPESFRPFEEKAHEIIAASEFAGAEKRIEYSYIKGREIA